MAVTKIWPVKDSIGRLIDYAKNPDKTAFENLETVMAYAKNEDKVIFEEGETCYLVTALNCRGDPLESMMKVQKHFGVKGENLAYHAYRASNRERLRQRNVTKSESDLPSGYGATAIRFWWQLIPTARTCTTTLWCPP